MGIEVFRGIANANYAQNQARVTLNEDKTLSVQSTVSVGDKFGRAFRVSSYKASLAANIDVRRELAESLGRELGISTKNYTKLIKSLQETLGKSAFDADYFLESGLKSGRPLSSRRITQIVNAMDDAKAKNAAADKRLFCTALSGIGAESDDSGADEDKEIDALIDFNRATEKANTVETLLANVKRHSDSHAVASAEIAQSSEGGGVAPEQDRSAISDEMQKRVDACLDKLLQSDGSDKKVRKQLQKIIDGMSPSQREALREQKEEAVRKTSEEWKALSDKLPKPISQATAVRIMDKLAAKTLPDLMQEITGRTEVEEVTIDSKYKDLYKLRGYAVEDDLLPPKVFIERSEKVKVNGQERLGVLGNVVEGVESATATKARYEFTNVLAIPLFAGEKLLHEGEAHESSQSCTPAGALKLIDTLTESIKEAKADTGVDDKANSELNDLLNKLSVVRDNVATNKISEDTKNDLGRIYAALRAAGCKPDDRNEP